MLIAQITDTHIVNKTQHWYSPDTKIAERLKRIVSHLNAMDPAPDVVLLTGDATDRGDPEAYLHLKELLKPLNIPLFVIPGNHDLREGMRKAFQETSYMPKTGFLNYVVENFPVRLIGLDTLVEGKGHGLICEERCAWLKRALALYPDRPTLIFMHHPPVKTGTMVFDRILCHTHPDFEPLIRANDQILSLVTGHYHHLCFSTFANKPCIMCPSVAPVHYFAHPLDEDFTSIELEDPAITLHEWNEGFVMRTRVIRLKNQVNRLDRTVLQEIL